MDDKTDRLADSKSFPGNMRLPHTHDTFSTPSFTFPRRSVAATHRCHYIPLPLCANIENIIHSSCSSRDSEG